MHAIAVESIKQSLIDKWRPIIRKTEEELQAIQEIAQSTLNYQIKEAEYATKELTFPVTVMFPNGVIHECDATDYDRHQKFIVATPSGKTMVIVSRSHFNYIPPKSIMHHDGDYSATNESVTDPSNFKNTAFAIKGIDYAALGFKAATTLMYSQNHTTWMAPHHFDYATYAIPIIKKYDEKLQKYKLYALSLKLRKF
jgi:hypothetical protein